MLRIFFKLQTCSGVIYIRDILKFSFWNSLHRLNKVVQCEQSSPIAQIISFKYLSMLKPCAKLYHKTSSMPFQDNTIAYISHYHYSKRIEPTNLLQRVLCKMNMFQHAPTRRILRYRLFHGVDFNASPAKRSYFYSIFFFFTEVFTTFLCNDKPFKEGS